MQHPYPRPQRPQSLRRSASAAWACPSSTRGRDDAESIATIHRALELGVTFLDTADMYGPFTNEELVGRRSRAGATRSCSRRSSATCAARTARSSASTASPEYVRAGLRRVARAARHRPHRPLLPAPRRSKRADRGHGRRDGGARDGGQGALPRACPRPRRRRSAARHAVHPIAALQTEYSLWSASRKTRSSPTLRELGIGFVPYSPLGRGFLTGRFKSFDDLPADDFRRNSPRFQGENFQKNLDLVAHVEQTARGEGMHAGAARARLAARPGRRHRADSGHQAREVPGGERRRARRRAHPGGSAAHRRDRAEGRRGGDAVSGCGDGDREPVAG